jgi:hypothetical protein
VLHQRRRGADAHTVSPVIELCSWFLFITLTMVRPSATWFRSALTSPRQHCAGTIYFVYHAYLVLGTSPLAQLVYLADEGSKVSLLREAMYGLSALGTEVMLVRGPALSAPACAHSWTRSTGCGSCGHARGRLSRCRPRSS